MPFPADGFLGLKPTSGKNNNENILYSLKKSGLISNAALTIYMNFNGTNTTKVRFGNFVDEFVNNDVAMHWFTTLDPTSWTI